MNHLQPLLEEIGFNHLESAIYLYLIGKGELPASKVAREIHIPRSTVRGILDTLCLKGIMTKITKRHTQYYSCKEPKSLIELLKKQITNTSNSIKKIETALPMLKALHRQSGIVPKVQVYEGPDQIIEAFNHSLFVEGIEEILFVTSYRFLKDPVVRRNDIHSYVPRRVKKGIKMRVLVGQADEEPKPKKYDKRELRQRRVLTSSRILQGNFHIYGNFVAYFSAGEGEYLAIIIESSVMSETMRSLFEVMWEKSDT